jgi:hypothetical protein
MLIIWKEKEGRCKEAGTQMPKRECLEFYFALQMAKISLFSLANQKSKYTLKKIAESNLVWFRITFRYVHLCLLSEAEVLIQFRLNNQHYLGRQRKVAYYLHVGSRIGDQVYI